MIKSWSSRLTTMHVKTRNLLSSETGLLFRWLLFARIWLIYNFIGRVRRNSLLQFSKLLPHKNTSCVIGKIYINRCNKHNIEVDLLILEYNVEHRLSQSRSLGFLVWCGRTRHERRAFARSRSALVRSRFALTVALRAQKLDLWASLCRTMNFSWRNCLYCTFY